VSFDRMGELLDFRRAAPSKDASRSARGASIRRGRSRTTRRWYTLRQYQFLADVERTFNDVAMDGRVLT